MQLALDLVDLRASDAGIVCPSSGKLKQQQACSGNQVNLASRIADILTSFIVRNRSIPVTEHVVSLGLKETYPRSVGIKQFEGP